MEKGGDETTEDPEAHEGKAWGGARFVPDVSLLREAL
jgi:hypothetical protein